MFITFYYHATHVNSMILNGESAAFKLGKEGRISHATVLLKKILRCTSTFHFRECVLCLSHNLQS